MQSWEERRKREKGSMPRTPLHTLIWSQDHAWYELFSFSQVFVPGDEEAGRPGLRSTTPSPSRGARDASMFIKRLGHAEGSTGMPTTLLASEHTNAISDARQR